jgi:glutathionyl-hydroquinone reductase
VPVLWDKKTSTIVSNESSEIIRMFNGAFAAFTDERTDYYPTTLRSEIDAVNARVYETLNNGVYRCGLATGQAIYEQVVTEMFATLDWLEARLAKSRYLVGETITEADWRLFPTLLRFDAVYYALFKCNLRHIYEYPALWRYARALYQMPGIAATCDIDECKLHYYGSLRMVNPSGVVPKGPKQLDFTARHGRG